MNRMVTIVGVVGLVLGLVVGYLWWGAARRPPAPGAEARAQLERQLDDAQARSRKAQEELRALRERLQTVEADLARERQQRARLEMIVSEGRK